MDDYMDNYNLQLGKIRELKEFMDSCDKFTSEYRGFTLKWAMECISGLFDRCPFRVGNRVKLLKEPDFENAPGWVASKHFLNPGELATVKYVDFRNKNFIVYLIFDNESWMPTDGPLKGIPQPTYNKALYGFRETDIAVIDENEQHVV